MPEIISKLSQKFIAALEYFPNMFSVAETISAAEIILFQFQSWLHVK